MEEFKNENPHVFRAQRDHPFEGMSNPVAQTVMRCNVDVKYIGRTFAEADLLKFCDGTVDEELRLEVPVSASSPSGLSGSGLQEMERQDPAPSSTVAVAGSSSDLPHVEQAINLRVGRRGVVAEERTHRPCTGH